MGDNTLTNPLVRSCLQEPQDEWHRIRLELSDDFKACRKIFIALGDETRQCIYITLLESRNLGMRVGAITEQTHLSRPAVSHHLQILKDAGLVAMHREGTRNFYFVNVNEEILGTVGTLFGRIRLIAQKITGEQKLPPCSLAFADGTKESITPSSPKKEIS